MEGELRPHVCDEAEPARDRIATAAARTAVCDARWSVMPLAFSLGRTHLKNYFGTLLPGRLRLKGAQKKFYSQSLLRQEIVVLDRDSSAVSQKEELKLSKMRIVKYRPWSLGFRRIP